MTVGQTVLIEVMNLGATGSLWTRLTKNILHLQSLTRLAFNPIPVGLIFEYFLGGGGDRISTPPSPLKSALIEAGM